MARTSGAEARQMCPVVAWEFAEKIRAGSATPAERAKFEAAADDDPRIRALLIRVMKLNEVFEERCERVVGSLLRRAPGAGKR